MRMTVAIIAATVASCAASAAGSAYAASIKAPYDVRVHKTAHGVVLTDPKGMTLYIYSMDTAGNSSCVAACAVNWPPLEADSEDRPVGQFTIITRPKGGKQWAYHGKPLYKFKGDSKPGQAEGDGIGGVWRIARPS